MSEKTIKMGIESLSLPELLEKIAIKKKKASERQRKFREEQKVKNPNYYKERAEYQKAMRNKEKAIYTQAKISVKTDIKTTAAKETEPPVITLKEPEVLTTNIESEVDEVLMSWKNLILKLTK
jgi:hypothetical protein